MTPPPEGPRPPYVVMRCVNCGKTYKCGPQQEPPYCPMDYGPLYVVKVVAQ